MSSSGQRNGMGEATRKQRREQARAERKALEAAQIAQAKRKKKLLQIIAAVAGVAVLALVAVLATGGSKSKVVKHPQKSNPVAAQIDAALAGIPQSKNALGSPTAPVTLQYFGDLQCPACKEFSTAALPTLVQNSVRSGQLRIIYRSLQTATQDPAIFATQQVAALAAGKQGKEWNFIELFYNEQGTESSGYVTDAYLQGLAQQIPGLNLASWSTARNDSALTNEVQSDVQTATSAGLSGTPAFMVGKTGGTSQVFSPPSLSDPTAFTAEIAKFLK